MSPERRQELENAEKQAKYALFDYYHELYFQGYCTLEEAIIGFMEDSTRELGRPLTIDVDQQ